MLETLRTVIEFMAAYPLWAKLLAAGGLLLSIGTLIVAHRVPAAGVDIGGVEIGTPRGNETVPWAFPVEGRCGDLPSGFELWVMTTDSLGKRFWPQERVIVRADRTWRGHVKGIGGEIGQRRTFGVFLVGPDGQALLNLWERAVASNQKLELLTLTHDIRKVAEVEVVVGSGRP